ncbi:MAG TPA: type VI secretion system ImpA family N-terminal domain-containing protein [Stellaceae bacterium]|nr:type VI secretion system ImpA family N-terminal domain-containing protein [Stellaceae bacterium]
MAETDIELAPISDDAPCGPDLDAEGDPKFMNFLATYEGLLPDSYFNFDRATIDFPAAFAVAAELKKRTQDLRLNLLVAKLSILNRDFYGFAREVSEIAWLLANRWDEAHPQAERGQYSSRLAQLATLGDSPVVALPLQYATLLETQREGPLAYRAVMITLGDAKLREGEKLASAGAIERMLATIEMEDLLKAHAALTRLGEDLDRMYVITAERVDFEHAVKFEALTSLVAKMRDFAQDALARRDPAYARAPEGGEPGVVAEAAAGPGSFDTLADVDSALASALGYFQAREPSSPALLLIAQARATLGKNLYEVIRMLAPRHADNARVFVGPAGTFAIPVSSLQDAPALDFSPGEAPPAETRNQAFALIEQVAAHLRTVEPSNPAPYLLDRARSLATRDFLSLLGEVFPSDDLDSMKNGN